MNQNQEMINLMKKAKISTRAFELLGIGSYSRRLTDIRRMGYTVNKDQYFDQYLQKYVTRYWIPRTYNPYIEHKTPAGILLEPKGETKVKNFLERLMKW